MSLFLNYKDYKTYVKKHSWKDANDELLKMIKTKYGNDATYDCIYCAFAALNEDGYISDENLRKIHQQYINKKKTKIWKKMLVNK